VNRKQNKGILVYAGFILCLSIVGMVKMSPSISHWAYPLAPHSYMHHHSIPAILDKINENPKFLQDDLLVSAIRDNYFLNFRFLLKYATQTLGLTLASFMNITSIIAVTINLAGICALSQSLFRSRWAALFSMLLVITMPCEPFLHDAVVNQPRFIAQGIGLLSLALIFRRRYIAALVTCALGAACHYGMSAYLMAAYSVLFLFMFRRIGLRRILTAYALFMLIFISTNLPLLLNVLRASGEVYSHPNFVHIVRTTGRIWSFAHKGPLNAIAFYLPFVAMVVVAHFVGHRARWWVRYIVAGLLAAVLFHVFVFELFFISTFARATFYNAHYWLPLLRVVLIPGLGLQLLRVARKEGQTPLAAWAVFALLLDPEGIRHSIGMSYQFEARDIFVLLTRILLTSAVIVIVAKRRPLQAAVTRWLSMHARFNGIQALVRRESLYIGLMTAMCLFAFLWSGIGYWSHRNPPIDQDSWLKTQMWARENTDPEDQFLLPQGEGLFGWRIYAERSTPCAKVYEAHLVVLLSPGMTDAVVDELTAVWRSKKGREVASPDRFAEVGDLVGFHMEEYSNLSTEDIRALAKKWPRLRYAVRHVDRPLDLPEVYSNERFAIYRVN
jgi:hypothetical protein